MIAVVDCGAGNLFSLCNGLDFLGIAHFVTSDPAELTRADGVILPGVGAFRPARERLRERGLDAAIAEQSAKKPLLGICLGMQLLFARSFEFGETDGLALLPGDVVKITAPSQKIPHMGWNDTHILRPTPLLTDVPDGAPFYFVHSYRADPPDDAVLAACDYGERIPAVVGRGTVYGTQFHPEKSGDVGLQILKNFAEMAG